MATIDQNKLAEVLDVDVYNPAPKQLPSVPEAHVDSTFQSDFEYARGNIFTFIETGKDALQEALTVASASESARGFEVVGGLLKNLSEINKQLIDIHKQKTEISTPAPTQPGTSINNAVFVGSTAELLKLIGK